MEEKQYSQTVIENGNVNTLPSEENDTTDALDSKLCHLQQLLRSRLPQIRRWKKVSVFIHDDELPPAIEYYRPAEDNFIVFWNGNKGKNKNNIEIKEIPLTEIDEYISKTKRRLNDETKTYK